MRAPEPRTPAASRARSSAAATSAYTTTAASDDERVDVEHERRLRRSGAGGQTDEIRDDGGERQPRERAGHEPRGGDRECAQAHDPAQQRRRGTLGLEIEQLAAVVSRSPSTVNRIPARAGRARRSPPPSARAASRGDRIATGVSLERPARLDREHVERLRRERAVDLRGSIAVAQSEPDLVHTAGAGPREVDGGRERRAVPDDGLAVDAGNRPIVPTTCTVSRSPAIWSGSRPASSAAALSRGVASTGSGSVGCRQDPGRDRVVNVYRTVDPSTSRPRRRPSPRSRRGHREFDRDRSLHRLARVGAALLDPGVRLDRDPREPAAASFRRQRIAEGDAREAACRNSISAKSRTGPLPPTRARSVRPSRGPFSPPPPRSGAPTPAARPGPRCRASRSDGRAQRVRSRGA